MKLTSVRIRNFRSFRDVSVPINDYTCLVGPNGSGKSTVIAALNVFFRHQATATTNITELQEEDFHQKNTSEPVEITLTFEDLADPEKEDFKDYFRQDKLIVFAKASWDPSRKFAPVSQHGIRLGMAKFKKYFAMEAQDATAKDLKAEYAVLKSEFPDLPAETTKKNMADALHAYEAEHPDQCEQIQSSDKLYGFTEGARLAKYVQWVHVPAVKDAADEAAEARETWLGLLLARAVRSKVKFDEDIEGIKKQARDRYEEMLQRQQAALAELSGSLSARMAQWASPDSTLTLKWEGDPQKAINVAAPLARVLAGDGGFDGAITRHGHGFQRSYLLTLLQELAAGGDAGPKLILACEEPELYQHPPQARHLASVFEKLSRKGAQVLVCTHSPLFVSGRAFEDIRLIRRKGSGTDSRVSHTTFDQVSARLRESGMPGPRTASAARARLHQSLQATANELFFSPVLVLVEGLEDSAYITAHLALTNRLDDFRRLGCHIVRASGKSYMPELLAVAKLLEIPTFVVFDSDANASSAGALQNHRQENAALLHLAVGPGHPPFPEADEWLPGLVRWRTTLTDVVKADFGAAVMESAQDAVRNQEGLVSESGLLKNELFIGLVLAHLDAQGRRSASLERLCQSILEYARSVRPTPPAPPADPPPVSMPPSAPPHAPAASP